MKRLLVLIVFLFVSVCSFSSLKSETATAPKMQHTISNLETELSYLKQKIDNQETTIETLRQEISALISATKELAKASQSSQEAKIAKLEKNIEKLIADVKQFKSNANENAELITQTQKSVQKQSEVTKLQEKEMHDVQAALQSLAKAMRASIETTKSVATDGPSNRYRVKSGDSLAKIAKEQGTSAQALKELNGLQSDKIIAGQELKISQ